MNKKCKVLLIAVALCAGTVTFAGPHHRHHHNDGLELANGIVDLVLRVTNPAPVVVVPPPPPPVVVAPPPPPPVVVAPPPPPIYYRRPAPPPPPRRYRHAPPRHHHRPGYDRHHRR